MEKQEYIRTQEVTHTYLNSRSEEDIVKEIRSRLLLELIEDISHIYFIDRVVMVSKFDRTISNLNLFGSRYDYNHIFTLKITVFHDNEDLLI